MAEVTTTLNIGALELEKAGIKLDTLKGEVAVVTGGASNIGLGYARSIAGAGGCVVIADMNEEAGVEVQRVINEENGRDCALFVKTNITEAADIDNLKAQAYAKFGKVDILVNNAMNMRLNGKILESPVEDLDMSYAISGRGVALAIKAFVPDMIERKHGIVTYSATQFHYAPPMVGGTIYTAGKAAATSVVMSLANELNEKGPVSEVGVKVFCLCPAGVMRFDAARFARFAEASGTTPVASDAPPPPKFDMSAFKFTTPEENGAAMVFCLERAEQLHGSGVIHNDVFKEMGYPFHDVKPVDVPGMSFKKLTDMELTMVFCYMGQGFGN